MIRKILGFCLTAMTSVGSITVLLLSVAIYIWSIVIAYILTGLIGAFLTLCLPIVAQIYWGVHIWIVLGTPYNRYCLGLFAWVLAVLFTAGMMGIAALTRET